MTGPTGVQGPYGLPGAPGTPAAGGEPPLWTPQDHGFVAWTFDPVWANNYVSPAASSLTVAMLAIRQPTRVTGIVLTGLGSWAAGAGGNFAGLYGMDGVRLATSTDQQANWGPISNAPTTTPIPATDLGPGHYYVAVLGHFSNAPAWFHAVYLEAGVAAVMPAGQVRAGTGTVGATLPAQLGVLTPLAHIPWFGLAGTLL